MCSLFRPLTFWMQGSLTYFTPLSLSSPFLFGLTTFIFSKIIKNKRMKFAVRVSPVFIGSTPYSSVVFGDEQSLIPVTKWPNLAISKTLIVKDGVLFCGSPWQVVSAIFAEKEFIPRDASVESDRNSYLITWQVDEENK